jgi:hypothetical protein
MQSVVRRFLADFYEPDLWAVLATCGVFPWESALPPLTGAQHLCLVAATAGLAAWPAPIDAVVASTCIEHSEADPQRLSASVVADLVHGAAVSCALGVPLLSFLGTGEEIRLLPGGQARADGWMRVADVVAGVFEQLRLPARSQILRSDRRQVWQALCATADADREQLDTQALAGLYHLTDGSLFPLGTPFTCYYDYYRLNIAHYRRPFLEQLLGGPLRGILVVENVQQVKAVAMARRLNAGWPTEHLVTLPAPGRAGPTRATRAPGRQGLRLYEFVRWQQEPALAGESGLAGDHLRFWEAIAHLWQRCTAGRKGVRYESHP